MWQSRSKDNGGPATEVAAAKTEQRETAPYSRCICRIELEFTSQSFLVRPVGGENYLGTVDLCL